MHLGFLICQMGIFVWRQNLDIACEKRWDRERPAVCAIWKSLSYFYCFQKQHICVLFQGGLCCVIYRFRYCDVIQVIYWFSLTFEATCLYLLFGYISSNFLSHRPHHASPPPTWHSLILGRPLLYSLGSALQVSEPQVSILLDFQSIYTEIHVEIPKKNI